MAALKKLWTQFKQYRLQTTGITFNPVAEDPGNSDLRYTLWVDSDDLQFEKATLNFSDLNCAGINDLECNAIHCDPTSAGSSLPYSYTEPSNSWFFVNSKHPPTAPEFRVIDQVSRDFYRIQVSDGSLRTILDDDQTATY